MGSKHGVRLAVTAVAAMITVMAAAACSSSGSSGSSGSGSAAGIDLNTIGAAQAVKTAAADAQARHTVHTHTTSSNKKFTQILDGSGRTDGFGQDVTVDSVVTGARSHVHGEIRGDGTSVYMNDPGLPSEDRDGKTWLEFDLAHPPSAPPTGPGAVSPGKALYAELGVIYAHDDPRQKSLFLLAFPDLHRVGVETKDGRQALHVAGSATPDTLAATPPAGSGLTQDYLDFRRQQAKNASTTRITADLWIGADGLPIASSQTEAGPDGTTVDEESLSQWGVNFSVSAPPAADVYKPPSA